jgi:hypothetical protein
MAKNFNVSEVKKNDSDLGIIYFLGKGQLVEPQLLETTHTATSQN